jgi:hypothetical protein
VDLARETRIFGDVGLSGVLVEGEEQEPDDAHNDTDKRQEIWKSDEEKVRVFPQIADCS